MAALTAAVLGVCLLFVMRAVKGREGYDIEEEVVFDQGEEIQSGDVSLVLEDVSASRLKIRLGGCALEVLPSDEGNARVEGENIGKLQAYQRGDTLYVTATRKAREDAPKSRIVLSLPEEHLWEEVNMELGAGSLDFQGTVQGDVHAACAMGAMKLTLYGSEKDYDYDISCVAGNVKIAGNSYGGGLNSQEVKNGAKQRISLNCTAGSVEVDFIEGAE